MSDSAFVIIMEISLICLVLFLFKITTRHKKRKIITTNWNSKKIRFFKRQNKENAKIIEIDNKTQHINAMWEEIKKDGY